MCRMPYTRTGPARPARSAGRLSMLIAPPLNEGGALQDRQGFLEASNLCLAPLLALRVRLGLGDATVLDLVIVLEDGAELRRCRVPVTRELRNLLVERFELLRLVLHVLLLQRRRYLVHLRRLGILSLSVCLRGLLCREVLGKVRLHDLQDADDAVTEETA